MAPTTIAIYRMPVIERVITFFITYPVKSKQRKTTLEVCCAKIPLDIGGE
jgi:hypothetical protein